MEKGKTNNPNGRPKGKPNKITQDVRQWLSTVIDKNRRQMERDLKALEPKERLQMLEKLMQYVIPKQQAVSAEVDFSTTTGLQLRHVDNIVKEMQQMGVALPDVFHQTLIFLSILGHGQYFAESDNSIEWCPHLMADIG